MTWVGHNWYLPVKPGMLLHVLQCTGQPSTTHNCPVKGQRLRNTVFKKPCPVFLRSDMLVTQFC